MSKVHAVMRHVPQRALPTYAYVPGRHPHPVTDPRGHSFGHAVQKTPPLEVEHPERSDEFLYAVDLFNLGYYWEAHESWEGLWTAAGRSGPLADLLKGLIKLAAAGVKAREENSAGVQRHTRRAAELLQQAAGDPQVQELWIRLNGPELIGRCRELMAFPVCDPTATVEGRAVLSLQIAVSSIPPAD